jgi:hypothetical protein
MANSDSIEALEFSLPKVALVKEVLMHSPQELSCEAFEGCVMLLEQIWCELEQAKAGLEAQGVAINGWRLKAKSL